MKIDPPQEHDGRMHVTSKASPFFELVFCEAEHFKLGGVEREMPAGTRVWIVLRVNGRMLLQTEDKMHRWADREFISAARK